MTVAPWTPLAGVGRRDALWNALVSYAERAIPLEGGVSATFALADAPDPDAFCVAVAMADGPTLSLHWQAFPFNSLLGADISAADLAAIPPGLREALLEGMAGLIWSAVGPLRSRTFRIAASGPARQLLKDGNPGDGHLPAWFSVSFDGLAKEPVRVLVGCDRGALLDMLSGALVAPQKVHAALTSQLTCPVLFTLGAVPVTIAELRSLEQGTVVVLPEVAADIALLRSREAEYQFQQAGDNLTCLAVRSRERARERVAFGARTMDSDATENAGTPAAALSALRITIDFDLGQTDVPLSDLETWRQGTVVALPAPARQAGAEVTLRANGQVIGVGDLVSIDERLAVRISRLFFSS